MTIPAKTVIRWIEHLDTAISNVEALMSELSPSGYKRLLETDIALRVLRNGILRNAIGPVEVETKEAA